MANPNTCRNCGAALTDGARDGFCPKCLFRLAGAGTARVSPPDEEEIGTLIGRYKLLEKVGEGGFGAVYVAEQREPVKRRVALKIIKLGLDTRQVIARFEAERQALALMDHPNIARVLDAGATETGRPYFVMELVRGRRITDYCDQNNLSTEQRLGLFMEVCHAIQHAHQKGIIHRDIKPTNILVTVVDGQPVPKVIDFGIAKATQGQLTDKTVYTQLNQFIGTPAYMSPEQAQLSGVDVDTRSDIYSLGVLLYELLTGHTPFDVKTLAAAGLDEMRRMIREQEPPRPSTRISTLEGAERTTVAKHRQAEPAALSRLVRGDLDWIVMKCLEKERARRYETASSLALDIENHLQHEPVSAAAPSTVYRARKFIRRHKAGLAVAAALVLLLAAGTVASTWQALRATRAEKQQSRLREAAQQAQGLEAQQRRLAAEQEILARRRFYAAQINLANQAVEAAQKARALELLETQRPKPGEPDLRTFEWYYLWGVCNERLLRTFDAQVPVGTLAFSPDAKTLASAGDDGAIRLWDVSSGRQKMALRTESAGASAAVAFAPDGETLVSGGWDGKIRLWDLDSEQPRATLSGNSWRVLSVAISPDGRTLATGREEGAVILWDLPAGVARRELIAGKWPAVAINFSQDGSILAGAFGWGVAQGISLWNLADGSTTPKLKVNGGPTLALRPDGGMLATVTSGGSADIQLRETRTGQLRATLRGHAPSITALAFLPDGNTLASCSSDRTVRLWPLVTNVDDHVESEIIGQHLTSVQRLAASPDGTLLASGASDGSIKLWHVGRTHAPAGRQVAASFQIGTGSTNGALWSLLLSPDRKTLVGIMANAIAERNIESGKNYAAVPGAGGPGALSPDGKLLATVGRDGTLRLWERASGRLQASVKAQGNGMNHALAVSPDGRLLATAGSTDGTLRTWDLHPDAMLKSVWTQDVSGIGGLGFLALAFSPDGKTLAAAVRNSKVFFYSADDGRPQRILDLGRFLSVVADDWRGMAFSPSGRLLATGSQHGTVSLWDLETGRLQVQLKGHTSRISAIAFSPDGSTVATGAEDATVRLWDPVMGQERLTLRGFTRPVRAAGFWPDGRMLFAGDIDSNVRLWRADPHAESRIYGERGAGTGESAFNAAMLVEVLYQQQRLPEAGQAGRDALVADSMTEGKNTAPTEAALWLEKGKLLEAGGWTEEALQAMTRAVELASVNTNGQVLTPAEARLGRSGLLRRMNRLAEAGDDRCQALNFPRRDAQARTNLVDLSLFYNAHLKENWHGGLTNDTLASVPTGIQALAGTEFDIRGLIQLNCGRLARRGKQYPASVPGIPVRRKFARLHVLHATNFSETNDRRVGAFVLHYADGRVSELPILYGKDVQDWWQRKDPGAVALAPVAWTSSDLATNTPGVEFRLCKRTWDNPRPEAAVESIDFTSAGTQCAPFLVALTLE